MITIKLTNPMAMQGFEPSSVLVVFPGDNMKKCSLPVYGPNPAFKLEWQGEPDRNGLMQFNSISAESFADIAGTQNFIVEIIGGTEK